MTETHQQYQRRLQASRVARLKADPTIREHGIESTYVNWGCRCEGCHRAFVEARMARDAKRLGMKIVKPEASKRGWET